VVEEHKPLTGRIGSYKVQLKIIFINLGELEQRLCRESGFRIDGHLLEFLGMCGACQEAR